MWRFSPFKRRDERLARRRLFEQAHVDGSNAGPSPQAGPIEAAFFSHRGKEVHKWHHYLPLYDKYFAPYRGRPVRFLEIGVSKGGSLELWRDYFGADATIYGVDIDARCAAFDGLHGQVRIGSQDDAAFLTRVVEEMGGIDIVLDDGSHHSAHMRASLDVLFPLLSHGGLYAVEDVHCSYWRGWGGGYRLRRSFVEVVKTLIDDMHHWYHDGGQRIPATKDNLSGMHIYDSIVFLEKTAGHRPLVSIRPQSGG
jgi:hypothetical protein